MIMLQGQDPTRHKQRQIETERQRERGREREREGGREREQSVNATLKGFLIKA